MQTGCKNAPASSRLRVPQLHAAAGRLSPGNGLSRACLGAAPPLSLPSTTAVFWPAARRWLQVFGGLFARFRLVVWIGVLEVRGWFPIQLQHDPGVESPNHQSKPAMRGKLRRVPKKGRALRGKTFCWHLYHLICIKKCILVACKKHAAVLQTQVARRTEGRAGRDEVTPKSQ